MNKTAFVFLFSLFGLIGYAQHNEKTLGLSLGFLKFTGPSAAHYSFINVNSSDPSKNYTNNQYGRFANPGPGIYLSFRHFAKSNWLWGFCLHAEFLKNKVKLLNLNSSSSTNMYEGKTVFTSKSASVALNTGYRFKISRAVFIDLSPDLEFCFFLSPTHEKGIAKFPGSNQTITTDRDRDQPKLDIRTGLNADFKWHNYVLSLGYSVGHLNYYRGYIGGNPEAYSRLFRIGFGYTLRK